MATTYIHPHVSISKFAKTKTRMTVVDDSAPVMLSLFTATKGPENQLVKTYDYEDFTKTYGSTVFNKSTTNPEFLCMANWLNNGGSVLAYRMTGADESSAYFDVNGNKLFEAKDTGSYYNDFKIRLSYSPMGGYLYITILNQNNEEVEGFEVTENNIDTVFQASEFINIAASGKEIISKLFEATFKSEKSNFEYLFTDELCADYVGKYPTSADKTIVYYPASQYYLFTLKNGKDEKNTINIDDSVEELVYVIATFNDENNVVPAVDDWKHSVITYNEALILAAIGERCSEHQKSVSFDIFNSDAIKTTYHVMKTTKATVSDDNSTPLSVGSLTNSKDTAEFFILDDNHSIFTLKEQLKKALEYPVDVFFDGQYNRLVKSAIIANLATLRTDCHFFFNVFSGDLDAKEMKLTREGTKEATGIFNIGSEEGNAMYRNVSVYTQAATINNTFTGKAQWVGPTYFLSYMTKDVENKYGIQYPVAGLTRGTITGISKITGTPNSEMKDELYQNKINYIEKDTRGYKFMCQLTRDVANNGAQYTALSFVNNSRTTERIARELEKIGRDYLFEFNDSTTLNNMQETLNAYLIGWVQNRTLSMAECFVRKNQYNENAVDISMNIKFNGTIEIISIDITID